MPTTIYRIRHQRAGFLPDVFLSAPTPAQILASVTPHGGGQLVASAAEANARPRGSVPWILVVQEQAYAEGEDVATVSPLADTLPPGTAGGDGAVGQVKVSGTGTVT